jgi:hypothetical protein
LSSFAAARRRLEWPARSNRTPPLRRSSQFGVFPQEFGQTPKNPIRCGLENDHAGRNRNQFGISRSCCQGDGQRFVSDLPENDHKLMEIGDGPYREANGLAFLDVLKYENACVYQSADKQSLLSGSIAQRLPYQDRNLSQRSEIIVRDPRERYLSDAKHALPLHNDNSSSHCFASLNNSSGDEDNETQWVRAASAESL